MPKLRKALILVPLCLFLVVVNYQVSNAELIGVNVVSSYYHISGNYHDSNNGLYDSYDETSAVPISDNLLINYFNSSTGEPWYMYAESETFDFGVGVHTATWDGNNSGALAEAEWTFRPTIDFDKFTLSVLDYGEPWCEYGIYLQDLTTDLVIANYLKPYFYPMAYGDYKYYPGSEELQWPFNLYEGLNIDHRFNSDHLYKLYLYAQSDANADMQDVVLKVVGMNQVPEPSTMLLLATGLLGLAGLKRKFRKR